MLNDHTTAPFDTEAVYRTATQLAAGQVPAEYNDYFVSCESNTLCMFVLYWLYRLVFSAWGLFEPGVGHAAEHRAAVAGRAGSPAKPPCCSGAGPAGRGAGALPAVFALYIFTPFCTPTPWPRRWWPPRSIGLCGCAALGVSFAQGAPCARGGSWRAAGPGLFNEGQRPGACARAGALVPFQPALKGHGRQALGLVLAVALAAGLVIGGFKAYVRGCGLIDFSGYDALHMPLTHWIMMGLEHDGAYNSESFVYSGSYPTVEKGRHCRAHRQNPQALVKTPWPWLAHVHQSGHRLGRGLYGSPGAAACSGGATWLSSGSPPPAPIRASRAALGRRFTGWSGCAVSVWYCGRCAKKARRLCPGRRPVPFGQPGVFEPVGGQRPLRIFVFQLPGFAGRGLFVRRPGRADINNEQEVTPLGKR